MNQNDLFKKIKRNCYFFIRKIMLFFPNLIYSNKKHKYVFILSPPFSGSTLLNQILSSSKNVSCNNNIGTREGQTLPGVKEIIFNSNRWDKNKKLPWQKIKKIWRSHWYLKKPILLDKSTTNIMRIDDLIKTFGTSYFICLIRNPYAICEGIMRRSGKSAKDAAKFTVDCLNYQMLNIQNNENILFFSYEDLCDNTDNIINKIKNYLIELNDIDANQKFKAHNYKTKKSMYITNLNEDKIKKIQQKDLLTINNYFRDNKDLLDFFNYKLISY
tara:strand:+ start:389 stop:1204 length:816 start_codon:yes stop_codon:yes gene_type:complete